MGSCIFEVSQREDTGFPHSNHGHRVVRCAYVQFYKLQFIVHRYAGHMVASKPQNEIKTEGNSNLTEFLNNEVMARPTVDAVVCWLSSLQVSFAMESTRPLHRYRFNIKWCNFSKSLSLSVSSQSKCIQSINTFCDYGDVALS